MRHFFIQVVYFPLDLARLTVHSWEFFLEGLHHRFVRKAPDFLCPLCRDVDLYQIPALVHKRVKYKNIWMIRMLVPQIRGRTFEVRGKTVKLPVWTSEDDRYTPPVYTPLIAILLFAFWLAAVAYLLELGGYIPEEYSLLH